MEHHIQYAQIEDGVTGMKGKLDRYWRQFQDSRAAAIELPSEYYDAFRFGTSKEGAQAISALVIEGSKTATGDPPAARRRPA